MKSAVSNIALPVYEHAQELGQLADLEIDGLEVAPSRVWPDTWLGLKSTDVINYRKLVESTGLHIVGLHSLFFDHPELGLFKDKTTRKETLTYMAHLSKICRDLGGKTLIYGGGRNRGGLSVKDAFEEAISFFGELQNEIEPHGTVFCFEPLGPNDSDFINAVKDSVRIVKAVDSSSLGVQLDAKALVENNDVKPSVFEAAKPYLVHYHANEPGLGVLGSSGKVDHRVLGKLLKKINYSGYVSVEQRMIDEEKPLLSIRDSMQVLKDYYL
jgi:sugar phosphate isomerase/epimerase